MVRQAGRRPGQDEPGQHIGLERQQLIRPGRNARLAQVSHKAEYFAGEYSRMHTGITAHPESLTTGNLHLIEGATFVFLAAADAHERPQIMAWLRERGIPFIDVGMS